MYRGFDLISNEKNVRKIREDKNLRLPSLTHFATPEATVEVIVVVVVVVVVVGGGIVVVCAGHLIKHCFLMRTRNTFYH